MASVYTVSQVNAYIKNMFVQDFALNRISIKGEVSNCKYHTSGHIYFTLKDKNGAIPAVMFASSRKGLDFTLAEGQQVIARGSVDVYERDGRYQLYANQIELDGTGDLFRRFELLRNELEEMGMFAPEYKRPVPVFAQTVGIVTASTGAAIHDIINIASRRNPYVQLILYPAQVQGVGAKESIAKGIRTLDRMGLDVLIVGRGGGSIEDLWAFNEEEVARAIFSCETPVISAVGHETDVTIADYVADMRAPTPSAAAELAVFDYSQFEATVLALKGRLDRAVDNRLERMKERRDRDFLRLKLSHPGRQMEEKKKMLEGLRAELFHAIELRVMREQYRMALAAEQLEALSPLKRLSGGFGFITDQEGKKVESAALVNEGDQIKVRLKDGTLDTQVIRRQIWKGGEADGRETEKEDGRRDTDAGGGI